MMSINQLDAVNFEANKLKGDVLDLNSKMQQTGRLLLEKVCVIAFPFFFVILFC